MPQVLDSFFCFTLHTGTTLLGWLGFSSAVLSIITGSMSFKKIDEWIIDITNKTNSTEDISPAEMDIFRTAATSCIAIMIGFYIIDAVASLFLIYGAANNKKMFLVPWLWERASQLIFFALMIISFALYFFSSVSTLPLSIFSIVIGGFLIAFNLYCFLCVYSLFHYLSTREDSAPLIYAGSSNPNYAATTYVKIA